MLDKNVQTNCDLFYSQLNSEFTSVNTHIDKSTFIIPTPLAGLYRKTDGVFVPTANTASSELIKIKSDMIFTYTGSIYSTIGAGVIFYDKNKNVLSYLFDSTDLTVTDYLNKNVAIHTGAVYISFSYYTNNGIYGVTKSLIAFNSSKIEEYGLIDNSIYDFTDNLFNDEYVDENLYLNASGVKSTTNGTYGLITFPVLPNTTYCLQGLGAYVAFRFACYASKTDINPITGLITANLVGETFDGYAIVTTPNDSTIKYASFIYKLPTSLRVFMIFIGNTPKAFVEPKKIKPKLLPIIDTVYLDKVNGSDTNSGLLPSSPVATFATAKSVLLKNCPKNPILYIGEGVYREKMDLSGLSGDIRIIGDTNKSVIFNGGTIISGWTKTTGYNYVYQCSYTSNVFAHGTHNNGMGIVFEMGKPSKPISDLERHPLQRGLNYRLPYTEIQQIPIQSTLTATLNKLDADVLTGSPEFYLDSTNHIMYIVASDLSNPATNGYSYERIGGVLFTAPTVNTANLEMKNISFQLSAASIDFSNFNKVKRWRCSILASINSGFIDNANDVESWFDEAASCGIDGINGHCNSISNWMSLNVRSFGNNILNHFAWCHDNYDDGLSYHEAAGLYLNGGLFEYNGDRGVAPANTCSGEAHDCLFRGNGTHADFTWDVEQAMGEGLGVVNALTIGDPRPGVTFYAYNCVSENNRKGFSIDTTQAGRLVCINSLAKNNTVADYFTNAGVLLAKNCKVINIDISKKKVTSNTGIITIETFEDL